MRECFAREKKDSKPYAIRNAISLEFVNETSFNKKKIEIIFYLVFYFPLYISSRNPLRDTRTRNDGRSLTWRQCLLASQPICWSCGGSGSAEASRSAFRVSAANAECRALNHTLASALSAALNQHSCTPSGEWSSRIRPSENGKEKNRVKESLLFCWEFFFFFLLYLTTKTIAFAVSLVVKVSFNEVQVQQNVVKNCFFSRRILNVKRSLTSKKVLFFFFSFFFLASKLKFLQQRKSNRAASDKE